MSKKISLILSNNLRHFFENKYGNFAYDPNKPCSDTLAAKFLDYARDKYSTLQNKNDVLLSTITKFSIRLNINPPVLLSNQASFIFSMIFDDNKSQDPKLKMKLRSYQADFRTKSFLNNFITNINMTLVKQNRQVSAIYNPLHIPEDWLSVGNNSTDGISKASAHNILTKKLLNDCYISTLGWIALCCGYSWAELPMLFVNNRLLQFEKEGTKLVVRKEYYYTFLLEPAE
ncbi:hypothetical protein NZ47_10935 [Anaerovibrio lipolyticus]|uniref:Uncharacterized protein n=1 Tax=Anaerovibrio lipolyticus TaxID=82374 RepID=A0A0B2JSP8_9FIRM|nr:hypothetical protein [Anaerovibrio lipolyticus]KHM51360.1 hypothetical protein NZ47_10935 [Anaerovibrio lipolyticus]